MKFHFWCVVIRKGILAISSSSSFLPSLLLIFFGRAAVGSLNLFQNLPNMSPIFPTCLLLLDPIRRVSPTILNAFFASSFRSNSMPKIANESASLIFLHSQSIDPNDQTYTILFARSTFAPSSIRIFTTFFWKERKGFWKAVFKQRGGHQTKKTPFFSFSLSFSFVRERSIRLWRLLVSRNFSVLWNKLDSLIEL